MNREIIQQVIGEMQELSERSIKKGIKEGHIGDVNLYFSKGLNEIGCKILKEIYEQIDEELYIKNKRSKEYEVIKKDKKVLITSLGAVEFRKRLYRGKDKEYKYLFDTHLKIRKKARYTVDAESKVMEEVIETSYRRGGENASISTSLTKQTTMNMLKDLNIPKRNYVIFNKRKVDYLYIDADEDHIALQKEEKFAEINKLIYVYEGIEKEAPKSERKRLINPHYFGGISTKESDNTRLLQEVVDYIEEAYDTKSIKMIYINGDGGAWIKSGVNYFKKVRFVMDKFHITEYVNRMTNHLEDSQTEAKEEIYKILYKHDRDGYDEFIGKLYDTSINDIVKKNITDGDIYFRNNFESICLRFSGDENILGGSAEGHISHVLASRMSSRPMGWTIKGANKITALRLYKLNGGDIYTLVKANDLSKQVNTFKREIENDDRVYSATEIINSEKLPISDALKYVEHYQAELSPHGKTMLAIHNIKY